MSGDESSLSLVHHSEDASVQSKSPAMCLCVMICNLYWFSLKAAQPLSLLHAEHVVLNPLGSWVLDIIVLIQNSSGGWEGRCCAPLCFLMNVNRGRLADFQQQLRCRKSIQRGQIGLINCVLNIWRRCDGRKLPLHERLWLPKWLILTIQAQTHSLKTSIYSYLQSW